MVRACLIAPIAAAGTLLAGCGGSGGTRLTAGQLAAQGAAICSQASAAERTLTASNAASALPPIVTRELAALRKLSPPLSEQRSYAALIDDFSQLNGLLQQLSPSTASPEVLSRGRELAARGAALARELGLAACTSPQ